MKTKKISFPGREEGIALVIVLAFVVLLTGLVVAYFSRSIDNRQISNSSFTEAKADELARSALDIITGDLKQEIVNGSTVLSSTNPNNPATVYLSSSNAWMVPQKSYWNGVPTVWGGVWSTTSGSSNTTLIRVSGTGSPAGASPFVDHLASAALSTGTSANGRSITPARWNQHYLVPLNSINSTTDATPVSNFPAPCWVYVTGTGGPAVPPLTVQTSGTTPVIGRYAYAVYDEGALLDVNSAGYPADVSGTLIPTQYIGKGAIAFADLTTLGLGARVPKQAGINALIGWRNYASMQAGGAFPAYTTFTGTTTMPNAYKNLVLSNTSGFMKVSGSSLNGATDQAILTRQELINLVQAINSGTINSGTGNFNLNSLQFLGTFSRAVAAPSWSPQADAGNGYSYKTNAESSTMTISGSSVPNPNRDLANVRFTTSGTITHYFDGVISSGSMVSPPTTATYNVNAGDPLMQSRFSLSKIAWLSQANPDTGTLTDPGGTYATAIQACFGLKWGVVGGVANGGNACWSYIGSNNNFNSGTQKIETLDQVAAEGREPNFFEILKAAILNGSLGVNSGMAAFMNGTYTASTSYRTGGYGSAYQGSGGIYDYSFDRSTTPTVPSPSRISDIQIMQIGANIIDQYDADSYPTAIYFKYAGIDSLHDAASGLGIYGSADMVYGDENLPCLADMAIVTATVDGLPLGTPTNATGLGSTAGIADWWQPAIWNPHQKPNPANSSVTPPTKFKIQGYGTVKFFWDAYTDTPSSQGTAPPQTFDNVQSISFTDSAPTTSAFYAQPLLLSQNGVPNVTATTSIPQMSANSSMRDYSQNPFVGFWGGTDTTYHGAVGFVNCDAEPGPAVTFCLGWIGSTGFHPYSFFTGVFGYIYSVLNNHVVMPMGGCTPSDTSNQSYENDDPRTMRFSTLCNWTSGGPSQTVISSTLLGWPTWFSKSSSHPGSAGQGNPAAANFVYGSSSIYPEDWAVNQASPLAQTGATATYYSDLDGVIRPGDGAFGKAASGDGMPLFSTAGTGGSAIGDTTATGDGTGNSQHGRRPVVLNRPFRSVGELGYAYRDMPFKSLDFFSTFSADAALLDVFSVSDQVKIVGNQLNSVVAGQVSLGDAPAAVIAALMSGASRKDFDTAYNFNTSTAQTFGTVLAGQMQVSGSTAGPLASRADLVTRLGANPAAGSGVIFNAMPNTQDRDNKAYLESPVRALADVANTRTWNLMIDVVAQTGNFTTSVADLNKNFIVQGEKRYWLHIAIDRVTGKVVDEQLEPVYE